MIIKIHKQKILTSAGLLLDLIGAILLATSIGGLIPGNIVKGQRLYGQVTTIDELRFLMGALCLIFGFALQLLSLLVAEKTVTSKERSPDGTDADSG